MGYKTVNLRPETYERLRLYQVGGASLSDVVEQLMDEVEPEAVFQRALRVHRKRVAAVRKKGGLSVSELRERLDRDLKSKE